MGIKGKANPVTKLPTPRSAPLGLRIAPEVAKKLRKKAKDSGRTISGYVVYWLKEAGAL